MRWPWPALPWQHTWKCSFFKIFSRLQVPKDQESWKKYSVMRYQYQTEEARCIYTCVNMLGVYLSATPHGSSGRAYLSGFGLHYQYLTDSLQKLKRTTWIWVLKYAKYKYFQPSFCRLTGKTTKARFEVSPDSTRNSLFVIMDFDLVSRGIKGDSKRVATK